MKLSKSTLLSLFSLVFFSCIGNAQNLSLEQCRNMALEHNKNTTISKESFLAAQETRKAAFTQFLPNFSAMGTYMYNSRGGEMSVLGQDALLPVGSIDPQTGGFTYTIDDIQTMDFGNGLVFPVNAQGQPTTDPHEFVPKHVAYLPKDALTFDMTNIFAGGIGFTQPIFMGGKILQLYKMAKAAETTAQIKMNNDCINTLIEVDEAYWRVVSLQKKKELAQQYNELLKKTLNDVEQMFEEGLITSSEVLKVKVKVNESEMTLTKADNGLRLAKMLLNQICGIEMDYDYTLEDEAKVFDGDITKTEVSMQDIMSRPETQLLDQAVTLAQSEVKIARSRFMPNIVATGNYMVTNPSIFNGFAKEFKGGFVFGVAVQMPIFHFGERIHTLNAAKHSLKIAELKRDEMTEKMLLQANMKNNTKAEAQKQSIIAQNTLESAEENLRQAQIGFEEGMISSSDLMAAQTAWVSAKSELIDANINTMLADLYLNQALGKIKVNE